MRPASASAFDSSMEPLTVRFFTTVSLPAIAAKSPYPVSASPVSFMLIPDIVLPFPSNMPLKGVPCIPSSFLVAFPIGSQAVPSGITMESESTKFIPVKSIPSDILESSALRLSMVDSLYGFEGVPLPPAKPRASPCESSLSSSGKIPGRKPPGPIPGCVHDMARRMAVITAIALNTGRFSLSLSLLEKNSVMMSFQIHPFLIFIRQGMRFVTFHFSQILLAIRLQYG